MKRLVPTVVPAVPATDPGAFHACLPAPLNFRLDAIVVLVVTKPLCGAAVSGTNGFYLQVADHWCQILSFFPMASTTDEATVVVMQVLESMEAKPQRRR